MHGWQLYWQKASKVEFLFIYVQSKFKFKIHYKKDSILFENNIGFYYLLNRINSRLYF